jgi:hypothetical protein
MSKSWHRAMSLLNRVRSCSDRVLNIIKICMENQPFFWLFVESHKLWTKHAMMFPPCLKDTKVKKQKVASKATNRMKLINQKK